MRMLLPLLATFLWGIAGVAGEAPTIRIGTTDVPADCPLAGKQHPRLLFTKGDLPKLRKRAGLPGVAADLKLIEEMNARDPGRMSPTTAAVVYAMTGKPAFRQQARSQMLRNDLGHYVQDSGLYAYDILYEELTAAERREFQRKALDFIKRPWNDGTRLSYALGIWGDCTDTAIEKTIAEQAPLLERRDSPGELNWWAGSRGGDTRGFGYIHQNTMTPWANATMCWSTATGRDAWEKATWAKHMPMYFLYHLVPGFERTVHVGINCNPPASPGDNADAYFSLFAARWQNGPAQWYMENVVHRERERTYHVLPKFWGRLLWRDENLKTIPPQELPEIRYFDRMGFVTMRSGWDKDATMAHFQCGPFEIWDGRWGRNNADNNSFLIMSRGGCMAADTGTRWGNGEGLGGHMQMYFRQTVAHNSVTVGDEDVKTPDGDAVRGGQVVPTQPEWFARWGVKGQPYFSERRYEGVGRIVAYASCPEWTYAVGDASRSYSPDFVKVFVRQFLYLRPDTFVIFDRVESTRGELPKRWLLHTMEKPEPVGGTMTTGLPGYFSIEGDLLTAANEKGRIFCHTLLPPPAERTIEVIGGPEHRFEVAGRNVDMPRAWYERIGDRENFRRNNTFGEWRIEVTAKPGRKNDVFLHVLHCADRGTKHTIPCALLAAGADGGPGVRLTVGGRNYEVRFASQGPPRGTIRLGDQPPLPLPENVEDNYRRWQGDPRYRQWITNPCLRAAVGEKE